MRYLFTFIIMFFVGFSASAQNVENSAALDATPQDTAKEQAKRTKETPSSVAKKDTNAAAIYYACNKYFEHTFTTRESVARKATCNGYFFGIGSTLLLLQSSDVKLPFCLPESTSTEDIIRIFLSWAENHSEDLSMFATKGVIDALTDGYPCGEGIEAGAISLPETLSSPKGTTEKALAN